MLAVAFHTTNENGPIGWPCSWREYDDGVLRDGEVLMTEREYTTFLEEKRSLFTIWNEQRLLNEQKSQYIQDMSTAIGALIEQKYSDKQQRTYTFLYAQAVARGNQARQSYIEKVWDWVSTCRGEFYEKKALAIAASSLDALKKVVLDTGWLSEEDPKCSLEEAETI
jgi:hypothetical protein